jgi:urease accessory protein UreF
MPSEETFLLWFTEPMPHPTLRPTEIRALYAWLKSRMSQGERCKHGVHGTDCYECFHKPPAKGAEELEAFKAWWNDSARVSYSYRDAFRDGYRAAQSHYQSQVRELVGALEEIAEQDYRGNRPVECAIAARALAKYKERGT